MSEYRPATIEECDRFISRLDSECCIKCKFFDRHDGLEAMDFNHIDGVSHMAFCVEGWCRRFPPIVPMVDDEGGTTYPTVDGQQWCGEFVASGKRVTIQSLT